MKGMKKHKLFVLLSLASIIALSSVSTYKAHAREVTRAIDVSNEPVTVFAAAGTTVALGWIAKAYEEQTGRKVITHFASSSTLAKQITNGADFDVYISANPGWMDDVQDKGAIQSDSRCDLLTDKLALIAPADASFDCKDHSLKEILLGTRGVIAVGDPSHVPCGMYAKEALISLDCWKSIQDRIIPAVSVRGAQQYVETGRCDWGIVYSAGARQSDKVEIVAVFDDTLHSPIRFSAACAVGSIEGNQFLSYLNQNAAMNIFSKAGFTPGVSKNLPAVQYTSVESAFDVNEWRTLLISLKVATACTLVVAVPGIALGYVLARKSFPGQSLVNAVVCVPMVIPPVVTGFLALQLLGKNSILGNCLHELFGISIAFSWGGAVLVSAIMGFPLLVRSVKIAVEMIDQRYNHAAMTLGSGPIRTFLTITLPLAGPGVLAGLILAFARSLGEFGATATFAGNIPGKTQTLSLAIYNITQVPGAESAAMRMVGISILLSFGAMLGSEVLSRRMKSMLGVAA